MTDIVIERLGLRGDGIAPGPVYAARTLPGETVRGDIAGDRMSAPKIVVPSADRKSPPCPHYNACGGCALMHASDDLVADFKLSAVRRALNAQGLNAPIGGIATSPPGSRRRAVLSGRRTKKGALVGFHARASDTIASIPACLVVTPRIRDALPAFETLVTAGGSRRGEMSLAVIDGEAGLDVAITGGKALGPRLTEELSRISGQAGWARLTWNDDPVAQERRPFVSVDGIRMTPPPGAFLQATKDGEAALIAAVLRIVDGADTVVDLFAGCGTFALPLSRRANIHAVEGLRPLSDATRSAWRKAGGLHRLDAETRDLFDRPLEPLDLKPYDAAVIDPPRAGAEAQFRALADSAIRTVASVSCNPVTFARDTAILLAAGFRLRSVHVIDQFRWSPHVEIVAHLAR